MTSTIKQLLVTVLLFTSTISFGQFISQQDAIEDLSEFKMLLQEQSSYYQLSNFDFTKRFKELEIAITKKDSVPIYFLAFELEKIIAEIIDRHANIRMENFEEDDYEMFELFFPFAIASLDGNIVALKYDKPKKQYHYYSSEFPFLKKINGVDVPQFLNKYAYRRKRSPEEAKINDGLRDLRDIGELYFKQGINDMDEINLTLTNGINDKELILPLSSKKKWWFDVGSLWINREFRDFDRDENFDLNKLDKWLEDSIAYLAIPSMISYEDKPNLELYLINSMGKYKNAKALIIDIRGNGGGTREILNTLSAYFIQPAESPWVANVAYVRSDQHLDEDIASMKSRFLYNYDSDILSDIDRMSIDKFNEKFKLKSNVDNSRFSKPYYMVLRSGKTPLECPIFILVNEECFSAASVFTSAFKGLPNVKIAGINTNGSSGRSRKFYLKHSGIRVKLSTMLSFQRNGETLDGVGTKPDIVIERDENQILAKADSQLEKLIELIQSN